MRNVGKGRNAASVVLVGLSNEEMGQVREVLAAEAVLPGSSIPFGSAVESVRRTRPDVVIIGFNQAKDAALSLAQALLKEFPNLTVVALSSKADANDVLSAMRVGYKEFVVLPGDAARLRTAVHAAAYSTDESDEEKGLVVAVVGAKGGVGCTMLCAHLATELAAIHRVLCIDLDFTVGDVASMLDIQTKETIMDLISRADRLDERMLTGAASVHRSKAHVVAQPSELERISDTIKADDIFSILTAAAKGYQYVVLDCGTQWGEAALLALSAADTIVMVTTPDVIAVRDAYRRVKLFEANGIEADRIRLVVNRHSKTAFVKNDDIEQNLQIKVTRTIADDPKTVDQAINEGKLVRNINPKSDVARDISSLVAVLTDDGEGSTEAAAEPAESKGFFASLFGRR